MNPVVLEPMSPLEGAWSYRIRTPGCVYYCFVTLSETCFTSTAIHHGLDSHLAPHVVLKALPRWHR